MSNRQVRRALLSVSDKTGLVDFARALIDLGVELISTGGTRRALAEAGLKVMDISEVTGFPEILDGRVKTLHPNIHGGILAVRENAEHEKTLREQSIETIDLVVCNLYPFEQTVAREDATREEIIENIDIGGPSMVRSAAKNHQYVGIVTSPEQYGIVREELSENGGLSPALRERLAAEAFARTAAYDQAISTWFACRDSEEEENGFPNQLTLQLKKSTGLRYGENPHQKAAFYVESPSHSGSVAHAEKLHGKDLSYNNILDLDSALNLARDFAQPAVIVIKHNNPCGAAAASSLKDAFDAAYAGDPVSAFGGILGFNREVDAETAMAITEPNRFIECMVAPDYSREALEILTTRPTWKKNVRLLKTGPLDSISPTLDYRRVHEGLLVQCRDLQIEKESEWKTVTDRAPDEQEVRDLYFAWIVCKHVKSNAIVLVKNQAVVGVGAGQMSRVDSVHLAARKAGERSNGSVMASDAFFPFPDNIEAASEFGVTAVIQPGGSKKDQASIDACNQRQMAMVFTGARHFRH